uniref:Uncharacterized protein n=1 Tax=Rhodnius prolixus TaxID=13249 RepID=T1IDX6_RHOPR
MGIALILIRCRLPTLKDCWVLSVRLPLSLSDWKQEFLQWSDYLCLVALFDLE